MRARRVAVIPALLFGLLFTAVPVLAEPRPAIADQIAKTYGFDSFGQIEAIRFTFNFSLGPKVKLSRSWVWEPKTDRISYDGPDKAGKPFQVTYLRSQLASQSAFVKSDVDPGFTNDQYWLLFPFHLVWDSGATVTDAGIQKLPLGKGSAKKVVVKYPSDGGYTPGDTWELYVGKDGRIEQFVFRRGGSAQPRLVISTWADYKKSGPLLVAIDHRGTADGGALRVTFTNVAVKLVGSSAFMDAK